ncbi:MAG: protein rep [Bacteroidota bacterium]|jgi:hypothetical protein
MAKVLPHLGKANSTRQRIDKQSVTPKNGNNSLLSLDTIAQLVHAKGLTDLRKRAKNRYFSTELARTLTTLESPLNKAYRRTLFDCSSLLLQEGHKVTSRYCNARWCNTCNRIRTAKLLEGYRKPLEAFSDLQFVTLTIPNVPEQDLKEAIKTMLKTIVLIVRSRRRTTELNGIRKLECTYNAEADTYHPHFHFFIDGKENAEWIVSQWLQRNPTASHKAQKILKGNNLIELFKYTTKIVSKTDKGFQVYVKPLDSIFQAMYKLRTFQPFGNVRMVSEDIEDIQSDTYDIPYYESVVWMWEGSDWYSMLTGEPLTGYEPSKRMIELTTDKLII